jgi:hypothetical protein
MLIGETKLKIEVLIIQKTSNFYILSKYQFEKIKAACFRHAANQIFFEILPKRQLHKVN